MGEQIDYPLLGWGVRLERDGDDLIIETRVEPGGVGPPHIHPNQEERFAIQRGRVRLTLGRRKRVVGPGDEVVVPPGTRHGFENVGNEEARFRTVAHPAMELEGFFRETAEAARDGLYTRRGIPTGSRAAVRLAAILDRYRETTVMSSPPPFVQRLVLPLLRPFAR
jgi:mannose-6-phosphate isomerase-like protein (cupin superfamily)